jgi:hypothetical protein
MDGEGASTPADSMIFWCGDSFNISLGEVGVESGAGEQEFQEGSFITVHQQNRYRTTKAAPRKQERSLVENGGTQSSD